MSNQLTTAREAIGTHWKPASRAAMDAKRNALDALDAMLAQAVQGEAVQEPVRMVRTHGSTCWEEVSGETFEECRQGSDYECCTFYAAPITQAAQQPEQSELAEALRSIAAEAPEMGAPWAKWTAERAIAGMYAKGGE